MSGSQCKELYNGQLNAKLLPTKLRNAKSCFLQFKHGVEIWKVSSHTKHNDKVMPMNMLGANKFSQFSPLLSLIAIRNLRSKRVVRWDNACSRLSNAVPQFEHRDIALDDNQLLRETGETETMFIWFWGIFLNNMRRMQRSS